MEIEIKKVETEAEYDAALFIRRKVFIQEQKVSEEEEIDAFEKTSTHVLALVDGKPVGAARWRKTKSGIKLERFSVLEPYRGLAIGGRLVEFILHNVNEKNMYLHAQEAVIGFYEKYGFEVQGGRFFEAGIPHRKMIFTKG